MYLDHGAATPIDKRVLSVMQPYFSDYFYNPSSPYSPAVKVRHDYQNAKHTIAQQIGAKPDEIIITAGATESINMAFSFVDGNVIVSKIEHHAILEAASKLEATLLDVDERGMVSADLVAKAITPKTQLVSVALANHELGTVQPIRDIATVITAERQRRKSAGDKTPIYFHTDASQGIGQIDCNVARLGVDLLTLNAGKIYGPKQVGLLWFAPHVRPKPFIVGGGQELGVRSGTENVAGTVGFAKALELAMEHRKSEYRRLEELRDEMQSRLLNAFPKLIVSGHKKHRLAGHLHISVPGLDAERLVFTLEARGVYLATGSACAANKGTRSNVLVAIGMSPELADGSLRITLGRLSDEKNINEATEIIIEEVQKEYARLGK